MKVNETINYDKFEVHLENRDVGQDVIESKIKDLIVSMEKHGWIDAYPMHVTKNGGSKLKIKGGQNRFYAARRLGIPVKYVLCDDNATIHELEKATRHWTIKDYMSSYIRQGIPDYLMVKKYAEETGVPLTVAISLIGGESAGSNNKTGQFKKGTFRKGDQKHANDMKRVIVAMRALELGKILNIYFLNALSKCIRVKQFKIDLWIKRCESNPHMLKKQPTVTDYLCLIESIYNWKSQSKIPLQFLADQIGKQRQQNYGD